MYKNSTRIKSHKYVMDKTAGTKQSAVATTITTMAMAHLAVLL